MIAVGDIHGCIHALDALLEAIELTDADQLVVLGDVIDQGRDSRDVICRLIELRDRCQLICLMGNHEEMLLASLDNEGARRFWEQAGGISTIYSYKYGGKITDIPDEHVQFIRECRPYYETKEFIFVHANYDPELAMFDQPAHLLRWAMLEPEDAARHKSGKTAFCGHTEQRSGEVLDLGFMKCLDTACWHFGWLTAMDVHSGQVWQASRFGMLRAARQDTIGPIGERDPVVTPI